MMTLVLSVIGAVCMMIILLCCFIKIRKRGASRRRSYIDDTRNVTMDATIQEETIDHNQGETIGYNHQLDSLGCSIEQKKRTSSSSCQEEGLS